MQASTPAYKTTIAGAAMTVDFTLFWALPIGNQYRDITLTVEQLTVDRQLTTDMPDGTRLITGYPAAQLSLTLSGMLDPTDASKTIAWLLNPAQSDSPMYRLDALGSPISVQVGVYTDDAGGTGGAPELFEIFTGSVDDYTVDMLAGTVTITCLDSRSELAKAPALPLGAFSDDPTAAAFQPFALGPLLTPHWVLNYLAESIGLYSSPPARANVWFRMTGHGAAWPEVSPTGARTIIAPAYVEDDTLVVPADNGYTTGKFGKQVPKMFQATYNNVPTVGLPNGTINGNMGTGGTWFMECWVQATSDPSLVEPNGAAVNLSLQDSTGVVIFQMGCAATSLGSALRPYVQLTTFSPSLEQTVLHPASLTVPNDGEWHYFAVAFHYTSATGLSAVFYVDSSTQTATTTRTNGVNGSIPIGVATALSYCPIESLQITNETGTPPSNYDFAPSLHVDLDPSLNPIITVPDVSGQDAWSVIQQIAQAEAGICGFDETGVFRFANRDSIRIQPDQRTITPTYSLKTLQQEMGLSFVRNHIQVPVNQLQVQAPAIVWSLSTLAGVGGRGTGTIFASFSSPVVNIDNQATVMPSGGGTPGLSYYRASTTPGGGGIEVTNLSVTIAQLSPTTALITIVNPNPYPVFLVSHAGYPSPAGSPTLVIGGQAITTLASAADDTGTAATAGVADSQWPPLAEGGAVTNPRGERLLTLSANPFQQNQDSAQALADYLLTDLYKPKPLWRNVEIVPDPSLQLADRVHVADPVTTLLDDSALIIGVHFTASQTDWSQTLDLRSVGAPGSWILGVQGRSNLGVSTYV